MSESDLLLVYFSFPFPKDEGGQCKCNFNRLKDRKNLLQKYIGKNADLELQALYAVQALSVKLEHPPGTLYDLVV